jgi:hypothetical protein
MSLLLQQGAKGSFGQAVGGGSGDLLHGLQTNVAPRPCLAEGVPGNDFAPAGSQFTDFMEVLRGEFALRHGQSCLVLTKITWDAFLFPLYGIALCLAKVVVTSNSPLPALLCSPRVGPTDMLGR